MNHQAIFSASLDLLVHSMEANSAEFGANDGCRQWPARHFVEALRTVRVFAGHGIGNSTYVARNALPGDVVVCPNFSWRDNLMAQMEELRGRESFPSFLVPREVTPRYVGSRVFKTIWIDGASQEKVPKSELNIDLVLGELVRSHEQRVIILG